VSTSTTVRETLFKKQWWASLILRESVGRK